MRVREDSLEIVVFVVQLLNCVRLFVTPWTAARQASLSFTVSVSSNSCLLSQWCHPTISFSDIPFSSCFKSFPASGSFPMNWLFALGGQSVGASTSASVLPMNIQGWFPLGLTGLISLLFKELLSLLQHYTWKASILWHSAFFMVQLSHSFITSGKMTALTRQNFVGKVISQFFNTLTRFVIAFLPGSKCLLFCGCSHHLQWFWSSGK